MKNKIYLTDCPEVMKCWHPTKNGDKDPNKCTTGSHEKAWWKCSVAKDHEWEAAIQAVVKCTKNGSNGCSCCKRFKVVPSNHLKTTHPEIWKLIHPTKNGDLDKLKLTAGSAKKAWFQCQKFNDHVWEAPIGDVLRSHKNGNTGCSYCRNSKITKSNHLKTTHPQVWELLHPTKNGDLNKFNVVAGSHKKAWFQCSKASDHIWDAPIASVVNSNKNGNSGCPFCIGRKVAPSNCLKTIYPEMPTIEWDYELNNLLGLNPENVTHGSDKKVNWICNKCGNKWMARIQKRTGSDKRGCPRCNNSKGEKEIRRILILLFLIFKTEYTFIDCKHINILRFDFGISDKNGNLLFLIEYHGMQHYEVVNFTSDPAVNLKTHSNTVKRDKIKADYCKNNNIPLLIIPYWDFKNIFEIIRNFSNLIQK